MSPLQKNIIYTIFNRYSKNNLYHLLGYVYAQAIFTATTNIKTKEVATIFASYQADISLNAVDVTVASRVMKCSMFFKGTLSYSIGSYIIPKMR